MMESIEYRANKGSVKKNKTKSDSIGGKRNGTYTS